MGHVLKRLVAACVPCMLLLSGCGVAETEFHPGVAVDVGDRTVTTDRVDEVTTGFCAAVEDQIATGGQSFPLFSFKRGIVGQLALESAAQQMAQDFDVKAGDDYFVQLATIKSQAETLSADGRAAYVEVQQTLPYVQDIVTQIGAILLEREGEAEPTIDFQQARGLDELQAWSDREGITFDPRYGLEMIDGRPQPIDSSTSFAASEIAQLGATDGDPDPNYIAALPLSSTCG